MLAGGITADEQVVPRGEQREGLAGRTSREPAHQDNVPQEQQRSRSRSPAGKIPVFKRVARAGQHALFTDAMRRVEGGSAELAQNQPIVIKQEQESPDVVMLDSSMQDIKQEAAHRPLEGLHAPRLPTGVDGSNVDSGAKPARSPDEYDETSVVITNVHFEATPEQVGMFFHQRCGNVVRVTILKNSHGMPKGMAR